MKTTSLAINHLLPMSNNLSDVVTVNHQFKRQPLSSAFLAGLVIGLSSPAWAADTEPHPLNSAISPEFGIQDVTLVGNPGVLSGPTKDKLLQILKKAQGPKSGLGNLQAAMQSGQKMLEELQPGAFILSIPTQTVIDGGTVAVQISPILQKVNAISVPGFDEKTIRASLPPTFQPGAVLTGSDWFPPQSQAMLSDHPLKQTKVEFQVQPDQPVTAEVQVTPLPQSSITIDSFGNKTIGRGMLTVTHAQSNVGTANDVLSFYGASSLDKPLQVGLGAFRYTLPDAKNTGTHAVGILHSASHVDIPFLVFGNISGKGGYTEVNYRYSHYLNWGNAGAKVSKVFADLALTNSHSNTKFLSGELYDYAVTALPVTLGVEGYWTPESMAPDLLKDLGASMRVQAVFNKSGIWGLSDAAELEKARTGASSSSAVLRWLVDGKATVMDHARLNVQFSGQYTSNKLLPSGQMAIAGDRASVRGFINSILMGDSVAVLRTELEPRWAIDSGFNSQSRPYIFYDIGYKQGGNDERAMSVSSTGLGWRWTPARGLTEGLSLDVFAARKLKGASLDLQPGTITEVSKTTLWATGTYRF